MVKFPVFHYTHLDNFIAAFRLGQLHSRKWLIEHSNSFKDISIDPEQSRRVKINLTEYIPMFVGYYKMYNREAISEYLEKNYDDPIIYNPSFYGSLNKTLRDKWKNDYENIIILLINSNKIKSYVDDNRVRLFNDIAIKKNSQELYPKDYSNFNTIINNTINKGKIYCEIDLKDLDMILIPEDIEAIIVDNHKIMKKIRNSTVGLSNIYICELPRDN